jgi:hypothetical protein
VAVDPVGVVTAVWRRDGGTSVISAARFAGGAWSTPEVLSDAATSSNSPQVAAADDGTVTATWVRYSGANDIVQVARHSGGGWSTATDLSAAGADTSGPRVVVDAAGVATIAWRRFDGADWVVQAARYSNGGWSPAADVSAAGNGGALEPEIAAGPDGVVTAVWSRFDGTNYRMQASRFAAGTWGTPVDLSQAGVNPYAWSVAMDAAGAATAVWATDSPTMNMQAARYVVAPMAPRDITGTAGDTRVAVAWNAPLSDGGDAITSYAVTASPGGRGCTATATTGCTVDGLANGTAYTFTVTATTAQGASPASEPSAAVTPRSAVPSQAESSQGGGAAPPTPTVARLPTRWRGVGMVGLTTGIAPQGTTRVTQTARRVSRVSTRATGQQPLATSSVTARCRLSAPAKGGARAYRCTIRLSRGTWSVTTRAIGPTGTLAQSVRRVTAVPRLPAVTG